MGLFNTWKKVMFDPLEFYEKLPKKIGYREPSIFFLKIQAITLALMYLLWLIIGAFFMLIFGAVGGPVGMLGDGFIGLIFLFALLLYPILLLFSWGMLFVSAGITHLFVLIFGGKQGYMETFKSIAYAMAPAVFSVIPIVNWAAGIYTIVLQVMGIKHRQKLSWGKSVAVILIPIAVLFVFLIIGYMVFIFSMFATSLAAGIGGLP
ncbi:MAG: YIP1 family protein [Nanoarchaeota archaeon]|nr:YIP1 family protein [Nanoarchaeota archaeon]MBU1622302.1 YIP1 family protein [Nanoarchaeota archaeon]MBU1973807.1 YIP1 family protein [Nanoarchaeota archaeon]